MQLLFCERGSTVWLSTTYRRPRSTRPVMPERWRRGQPASQRPVPVCGKLSRDKVCQGIRAFCKKLSVPVPDLDHFLPCSLFTETGAVLRQLQNLAKHLAQFQYIRIADKGVGELWGFCGAWYGTKSTNSC